MWWARVQKVWVQGGAQEALHKKRSRATMAPPASGVGVHGKGIKELVLLRRRTQYARLDVWPFFLLYGAVVLKAIYHASQFQWGALTLSSYMLGGAGLLHILAFLFTHWSTRFRAAVSCTRCKSLEDADLVLAMPEHAHAGGMEMVALERRTLVRWCRRLNYAC